MPDVSGNCDRLVKAVGPDSARIWREVKDNHAKLDACDLHDFEPVPRAGHTLLKDFVCRKCGGRIDAVAHLNYLRGLADGKKLAAR